MNLEFADFLMDIVRVDVGDELVELEDDKLFLAFKVEFCKALILNIFE